MNTQGWEDPTEVIRQELDPGESLLWAGRPRQGIVLRSSDMVIVPLGIIWCIFLLWWLLDLVRSGLPWFLYAGSIPAIVAALYAVFGRFWVDARLRAATCYGVTNERIMIVTGPFSKNVTSIRLEALGDVNLDEEPDGSGSIVFGPANPYSSWYQGMPWYRSATMSSARHHLPPAFEMLPDVRQVYTLIRQAMRGGAEAPAAGTEETAAGLAPDEQVADWSATESGVDEPASVSRPAGAGAETPGWEVSAEELVSPAHSGDSSPAEEVGGVSSGTGEEKPGQEDPEEFAV